MEVQLYLVICLGVCFIWGTYIFLNYHQKHHTAFMRWLSTRSLAISFEGHDWWRVLQIHFDKPEFKTPAQLERREGYLKEHKENKYGTQSVQTAQE